MYLFSRIMSEYKDNYNNSVPLIKNKNHQEELKEDKIYVFFDLFLLYKNNMRLNNLICRKMRIQT